MARAFDWDESKKDGTTKIETDNFKLPSKDDVKQRETRETAKAKFLDEENGYWLPLVHRIIRQSTTEHTEK